MEKRKVLRFSSIFLINLSIKESIDDILTPIIIFELGFIKRIIIITAIYIIKGVITVRLYDKYKTDCIMMESLKEAQFNHHKIEEWNKLIKFIVKKSENNRKKLIFLLSFKNPGLGVLYMRDGFHMYNGFSGKNVIYYFLLNIIVKSIYWNIIVLTGFSLWGFLKNIF